MDSIVAAHDQSTTLHILCHIPAHEPRESDPHYHLFNEMKARMKAAGLLVCRIPGCNLPGPIEVHHSEVEFAYAGGVDLDLFNKAYGLHLTASDFAVWVEGPGNAEPLCLPGDAPVLMADGSERHIADVREGDRVIGHDGQSHEVTGRMERRYVGTLAVIDGRRMTPEHPVLTSMGWLRADAVRSGTSALFVTVTDAGGVTRGIRMPDAQMLSVRGTERQVLRPIVGAITVQMVNALSVGQRAADGALHDKTMLHDDMTDSFAPDDDARITGTPINMPRRSVATMAGGHLQRGHATGIRAVAGEPLRDEPRQDDELPAAYLACAGNLRSAPRRARSDAALLGTGRIAMRQSVDDLELGSTDDAAFDDLSAMPALRRWGTVNHVGASPFQGTVYDIEVEGSHSFITNGLAVHNCPTHHRTHLGVHSLPEPNWKLMRIWQPALKPNAEVITQKGGTTDSAPPDATGE